MFVNQLEIMITFLEYVESKKTLKSVSTAKIIKYRIDIQIIKIIKQNKAMLFIQSFK